MPHIRGCASHNKDIIKLHTDYDKFLADGINGSYSEKKLYIMTIFQEMAVKCLVVVVGGTLS